MVIKNEIANRLKDNLQSALKEINNCYTCNEGILELTEEINMDELRACLESAVEEMEQLESLSNTPEEELEFEDSY